jgi:hypothetical protein
MTCLSQFRMYFVSNVWHEFLSLHLPLFLSLSVCWHDINNEIISQSVGILLLWLWLILTASVSSEHFSFVFPSKFVSFCVWSVLVNWSFSGWRSFEWHLLKEAYAMSMVNVLFWKWCSLSSNYDAKEQKEKVLWSHIFLLVLLSSLHHFLSSCESKMPVTSWSMIRRPHTWHTSSYWRSRERPHGLTISQYLLALLLFQSIYSHPLDSEWRDSQERTTVTHVMTLMTQLFHSFIHSSHSWLLLPTMIQMMCVVSP